MQLINICINTYTPLDVLEYTHFNPNPNRKVEYLYKYCNYISFNDVIVLHL